MKRSNSKPIWTGPECLTCLSLITYDLLKRATDDPILQIKGMKKTYEALDEFELDDLPTTVANKIYRMVLELTQNFDPFRNIKQKSSILAKDAIKQIKPHIVAGRNPYERFRRALAASITGNMIDFGTAGHSIELNIEFLERNYYKIYEEGFAIDYSRQLFEALSKKKEIIFVADNAGEVYFDLVLLELMKRKQVSIIFAVKGAPISNDATMEDINDPIFKKVTTNIITTGSGALGVSVTESSQEFLKYIQTVDFIVAKGQSNFETLYYHYNILTNKPIFFIFRTKCSCISHFLGETIGRNIILLKNK